MLFTLYSWSADADGSCIYTCRNAPFVISTHSRIIIISNMCSLPDTQHTVCCLPGHFVAIKTIRSTEKPNRKFIIALLRAATRHWQTHSTCGRIRNYIGTLNIFWLVYFDRINIRTCPEYGNLVAGSYRAFLIAFSLSHQDQDQDQVTCVQLLYDCNSRIVSLHNIYKSNTHLNAQIRSGLPVG